MVCCVWLWRETEWSRILRDCGIKNQWKQEGGGELSEYRCVEIPFHNQIRLNIQAELDSQSEAENARHTNPVILRLMYWTSMDTTTWNPRKLHNSNYWCANSVLANTHIDLTIIFHSPLRDNVASLMKTGFKIYVHPTYLIWNKIAFYRWMVSITCMPIFILLSQM
jgi:hypothetical protein